MSLLTEGIGYESIRFYGPFQPQHIQQLHIHRAINEHAYLQMNGILTEEQGAAWIGQTMDQEPIVIRQLDEHGQALRTLFHGMITGLSIHCVRGVYTFELEAAAHSYQLDVKLKNRSYQEPQRTYDDLVTALVRKYKYGDAIDTVTDGAKLDNFLLQYQETDWAFLKRLASRFGSVLVPEVTAASPKIFFGLPIGKLHKLERDVFYRVRKTFHELSAEKPEGLAGSYVTYTIESLEYYALGDVIDLPIGQGKELVVVRAETRLEDGMLRTRYDLQAEHEIRYVRVENEQITGISLLGKVVHVEQERVQLKLKIDPEQHSASCWFPVATRYVAEDHSGWYNMPEIGDQVELYLPTNREQDAYVTDALRQQRTHEQPDARVWQHARGSGVELSKRELRLHSPGKVSITLHEASGVAISSPGNVQIQGGDVKLEAGKGLSLKAGTALYLKGGASSMVLDGETDLKAPVIEQEGTVKAPVFVTDLPPVWEPEIVSVQAYKASQSSAASDTSSGNVNSTSAKITSPAAEAAANTMLVTESKLVGSIPAMTGVLLSALGGPANKAVGVALQAAAVIPVRSDGKAQSVPVNNPLHRLKQLAGLLMQGLIDQRIYEEERQAYYTQWILGKMVTSARQVSHSNHKLELIYHLLNESNNIYQAYHEVPEDVRRRWEPPRYFPSGYEDTNRIILEVQASLNWSDALTEDVAKRVAEKQSYDDIVKEMEWKHRIKVGGGLATIYTSYNAEGAGLSLNELFTGYTHNSSEVPYIRGGGFNVRNPSLNRKKTEFKTMTQAELDKFAKSVKDRRPKDDPRNTTVENPKETLESPNPSNSTKGTGKADDFAKEPFLPDEAYGKNLPKFVEPGTKSLNKYDEFGNLKQTKYYDDYGREKGWIDYSNHGYPENHSVPHWHEVQWNEKYPIGGYKIDHRMDTNPPF
ncbi:hypothetical protein [Paenibacillus bouchesdurhonensis]|uniref:hypothetical protein n=1 Tax=Paenibacillus bouchesdurhonensis TaxID=1870990 RepID=UPI001F3B7021|nr:hypothetical protein [Paenibacillus bouchesdurhonensis]